MLWPRVTKMTLPPACATATPSGFTRTLTPKLLPCAGGALTCAKELYAQVPEMLEAWRENTPLKKNGESIHIAHTIEYIIGNGFLTGECIDVNGGLFMR